MKKTNAIRILDRKKVNYSLVEYNYNPDDLNAAKIAEENGLELKAVYKSLVLKGDKNGVLVAVIPGNKDLNLKTLAQVSLNKKVHLLAIKDLEKTTGYIRGGCSPIGMKKDYPVYISNEAKDMELIYINAGTRGMLIGLNPKDLDLVCSIEFNEISQ